MSDRPSSETERTDPPPANKAAGELFATTRWTMVLTAGKGTAISAGRAVGWEAQPTVTNAAQIAIHDRHFSWQSSFR